MAWPLLCGQGPRRGIRSPRFKLQFCYLMGAITTIWASGSFSGKWARHHEHAQDKEAEGALKSVRGQPGSPTVPLVRQICAQEGPGPSRLSTKRRGQVEERTESAREGKIHQGPWGPEPRLQLCHSRSTQARVQSAAASANLSYFPFLSECNCVSPWPHLKLCTLRAAILRVRFPWPAMPMPCPLCPRQLRHTPLHPAQDASLRMASRSPLQGAPHTVPQASQSRPSSRWPASPEERALCHPLLRPHI